MNTITNSYNFTSERISKMESIANSKLSSVTADKEIYTEPIKWKGQDTNRVAVYNADMKLYSTVGKQYHPITHHEVYQKAAEFVNGRLIGVTNGGFHDNTRAIFTFLLDGDFKINNRDHVRCMVNVFNSYDGGWKIGFNVRAIRLACSNQFNLSTYRKSSFVEIMNRHTINGVANFRKDIKLIEYVNQFMEEEVEIAQALSKKKISAEQGRTALVSLREKKLISKKSLQGALKLWDNPIRPEDKEKNEWTLFNALSEVFTRDFETKESLGSFNQIERLPALAEELVHV